MPTQLRCASVALVVDYPLSVGVIRTSAWRGRSSNGLGWSLSLNCDKLNLVF